MVFVPKRLQHWKPEHMRTTPTRRCYWCSSGPHRTTGMAIVMELPMRWHFCSDSCCDTWMQRRHDADAVAWLKLTTAERAKILEKR